MTQTPTPPSQSLNEGQVMTLFMVQDHGALKFRVDWKQILSDEQKYVVAEAVDRVMRRESVSYREAVEKLDEAAKIGWAVEDHPIISRLVKKRMEGST